MKTVALLVVLAGATACAGAQTAPATSPAEATGNAPHAAGVTMAQPKDDPKRSLSASECETLGEWIRESCHDNPSRSAQVEGWCSDVVSRVTSGSWATECPKAVHYSDLVCFLGSSSPRSMMTCSTGIDG